ncbi:MAG: GSCFA domain-containing protein [Muribaculaceae bacterium]|nr:GSCFA domain-containing protein [Muribaculaceae bacterium]
MKFRTEIEPLKAKPIDADSRMVFLGSCFADNMGARLSAQGMDVCHNPMGPLFNPASMARIMRRALDREFYTEADLVMRDGVFHALEWPLRFQNHNADVLLAELNGRFAELCDAIAAADVLFITFGTAWVYRLIESGEIVGNCHKLAACEFSRERLTPIDIVSIWQPIIARLKHAGKRVVVTVSPVRHTADGLHGNNLSKATLMLATEALDAEYFPSFEILCDDLRDYRFYGSDLKHPSDDAVEYIYEIFADAYFTTATKEILRQRRAAILREAHRPGNNTL